MSLGRDTAISVAGLLLSAGASLSELLVFQILQEV